MGRHPDAWHPALAAIQDRIERYEESKPLYTGDFLTIAIDDHYASGEGNIDRPGRQAGFD